MQLITQGTTGIRRPHVIATDAAPVSGTEFISEAVPAEFCSSGVLTLYWSDFDDTDALAHIEGSYDGTVWNTLDGAGAILNSSDDVQIWELIQINVLYLRVKIIYNGVTAGAIAFTFRGEFNDSKNY
jgi:hypothetical protein